MSDYEMPKDVDAEAEKEEDKTFYPHLKRFLNLNLVTDNTIYDENMSLVHEFVKPFLQVDKSYGVYNPIMYASDFWVLQKNMILLNDTNIDILSGKVKPEPKEGEEDLEELPNLMLSFSPFPVSYFQYH
jgi:hypothetical protein